MQGKSIESFYISVHSLVEKVLQLQTAGAWESVCNET